jgi:hypothetical protein
MRLNLCLAVGVVLTFPSAALLRAGDTPADLGAETVEKFHYVCDKAKEQIDYIKPPGSTFYFSAEALFLRRQTTNTNFPATSFGVGGPVIAQLQNLSFNVEGAPRITLGYRVNPWCAVEGTFFGRLDWSDQFSVTDPQGRLFGVLNRFGTVQQPAFPSPPFPATFGTGNNTTSQIGVYNTHLTNYEVNGVADLIEFNLSGDGDPRSPRVSFAALVGARYLRIREDFLLETRGDIIPSAGINDPAARASYKIDQDDDLFGGQIGLRAHFRMWDAATLGFEGKFAVLALGAEQRSNVFFIFTQPSTIVGLMKATASDLRTSTLGDISGYLAYDLTRNITLRGGYQLMWLNGRALAPDQVDANVAQTGMIRSILIDKGTTMFYGGFFGVEVRF